MKVDTRFVRVALTLSLMGVAALPMPFPGGIQAARAAASSSDVEEIDRNPELATFAGYLEKSGLKETISQLGPCTVFAPTNDAFAAMPKDELDALQASPDRMKAFLSLHIVEGRYTIDDLHKLANKTLLTTLSGVSVLITRQGRHVMVNGVAIGERDIAVNSSSAHPLRQILPPLTEAAE